MRLMRDKAGEQEVGQTITANKQPRLGHRFGFDCCQAGKYSVLGQAIRHCKLITAGIGHRHAVTKIKKKKEVLFRIFVRYGSFAGEKFKSHARGKCSSRSSAGRVCKSSNKQTNKQTNKRRVYLTGIQYKCNNFLHSRRGFRATSNRIWTHHIAHRNVLRVWSVGSLFNSNRNRRVLTPWQHMEPGLVRCTFIGRLLTPATIKKNPLNVILGKRALKRKQVCTHTRACTHTHTRARAHTHTHTHTRARAHTHIHTHTHTHTHTHKHINTHTHTQ